jgi:hypothetical protein
MRSNQLSTIPKKFNELFDLFFDSIDYNANEWSYEAFEVLSEISFLSDVPDKSATFNKHKHFMIRGFLKFASNEFYGVPSIAIDAIQGLKAMGVHWPELDIVLESAEAEYNLKISKI